MSSITGALKTILKAYSSTVIEYCEQSIHQLSHLKLRYRPFHTIVCLQLDGSLSLHPTGTVIGASRILPGDPEFKNKLDAFISEMLSKYKVA